MSTRKEDTPDLAQLLIWLRDAKSGEEIAAEIKASVALVCSLCDVVFRLNVQKLSAEMESARLLNHTRELEDKAKETTQLSPCKVCAVTKTAEAIAATAKVALTARDTTQPSPCKVCAVTKPAEAIAATAKAALMARDTLKTVSEQVIKAQEDLNAHAHAAAKIATPKLDPVCESITEYNPSLCANRNNCKKTPGSATPTGRRAASPRGGRSS